MKHSILAASTQLAQEIVSREFIIGIPQRDTAKNCCREWFNDKFSLGAGAFFGNQLCQVVHRVIDDLPVIIVVWVASALHLRDRNAWFG